MNASGEDAHSNLALAVYLRQRFGMQLPPLDENDSPESYFGKIEEFCAEMPRWRLRRFITIATFGYSKIAIYQDINPESWPDGLGPAKHRSIRELLAQSGVSDVPFAEDRDIDEDATTKAIPILAFEADSSQHSAVADVLTGANLTIYGPPGTGKSQTIANSILALMADGKSVLFVAEKLTALEVVQDRIEKAGFGPFCLNLHGRNSRPTEVRRQLSERINCHPPPFDETNYERNKEEWTRRRDALQSYAGIVGAKIGRLGETVHDVLWRELSGREVDDELPRETATLSLPDVEAVDAITVNEARSRLDQLAGAEAEFERSRIHESAPTWHGMRRIDLSLPELGPAFNLAHIWRERVVSLIALLEPNRVPLDVFSINDLNLLMKVSESVKSFPFDRTIHGPAVLASAEVRKGLAAAARRAAKLAEIDQKLSSRFGLTDHDSAEISQIQRIWQIVVNLGAQKIRIEELVADVESLKQEVADRARYSNALAALRDEFGGAELADEHVDRTITAASRMMVETGTEVLQARTDSLATRSDCARALAIFDQINDLAHRRSELAERFDLDRLPTNAELLAAADSLHMLRVPLMFSFSAKRAMTTFRQISLTRQKTDPDEAAAELRKIAQYRKEVTRFESGVESRRTLGRHWKGLDTDVEGVRSLVNWVEEVFERFGGTSGGRPQVREILLKGDLEQLAEIGRIASEIPAESERDGIDRRARAAEKRLSLINELVAIARESGLNLAGTGSEVWELLRLLNEAKELAADSSNGAVVRTVFGANDPDLETLAAVASVGSEISDLDADGETLIRILDCHRQLVDADSLRRELPGSVDELMESWRNLGAHLQINEIEFFGGSAFVSTPLARIVDKSEACSAARSELGAWCSYQRARNSVQRSHAAATLDAASGTGIPDDRLSDVYDRAFYRTLAAGAFKRFPELHDLSSGQLGNHRQAFKALEERLLNLERQRIAHKLYERPVEHGVSFGGPGEFSEKALLQHWLPLKRSRITVRDLCRRSGKALRQLKPCFLMSPSTVAEFIPKDVDFFDVVVIDEASQMLPSDALGSITRGKQCVVVGDPKQLPPTTFFGGSPVDAEDQDDEAQLAAVAESILDLALSAWRPPRHLRWHYRSRHSSLINFSNSRFYDNQLIVFPGPNEADGSGGVKFNYVANGLYQSQRRGEGGRSRTGNCNPGEAAAVVRSACDFMGDAGNRDLSLAIVAVNRAQRDLISEMLDQESQQNPAVRRYRQRWESTLFPLMVSHLEAVQGDERDVVFISTVYGPETPGGPVRMRFGPITHAGGERRLNVLFTRAKHRVEVFSSMRANDIRATPSSSEGVQVLRDYLEYAATGRIEVGQSTGAEVESPFEEHVLARLLEKGYQVNPQVGVAGYRIDLGVKHPAHPHGYVLGIECDGATYHSARSVRDRDRAREAVLRDLGWEIYRIWSTDWFSDPDYEFERLTNRIESLATGVRDSEFQEDDQSLDESRWDDPGDRVQTGRLEAQTPIRKREASIEESPPHQRFDDQAMFVEIGDTVMLEFVDQESDSKRVTIVRGPGSESDDSISDDDPLARAILGASVGEFVTIYESGGPRELEVVEIERLDSGLLDELDSGSVIDEAGVELLPYREWQGNAPDPRSTQLRNVAAALFQIIEVEGPVLESRAYRAYAESSGAKRLGAHFVRLLKQALAHLEGSRRIRIVRGLEGDDRHGGILMAHDGDLNTIRDIGPRDFTEIPLTELSALIGQVQANHSSPYLDDVFRSVLGCYGLTRMTKKVDLRFKQAMAFSDSGHVRLRFGANLND